MVAYSFQAQFEAQIAALQKRQTVRSFRKRHARPGEPMQLFTGMRTRHCRKILTPDPLCLDLQGILLAFGADDAVTQIELGGCPLNRDEVEAFAAADGFGPLDGEARLRMGQFWNRAARLNSWGGVLIRWSPR